MLAIFFQTFFSNISSATDNISSLRKSALPIFDSDIEPYLEHKANSQWRYSDSNLASLGPEVSKMKGPGTISTPSVIASGANVFLWTDPTIGSSS